MNDQVSVTEVVDLSDELTGEAEHIRDSGVSTEAEVHRFWHRINGPAEEVGCPWDACHNPRDDYDGPAWCGQWIDSADYCSGDHGAEQQPF